MVACSLMAAAQTAAPVEGVWYRIKSGETDKNDAPRANSYLGYYPEAGGVQGYVYDHTAINNDNAYTSRNELRYNPFICCGYEASPFEVDGRGACTAEQISAQLWQIIAGTGENEGKFALVNKNYPDGAISNVCYDNNGNVLTSGAANNSRWGYVADRTANASEVCWFSFSNEGEADGNFAAVIEFTNTVTPANHYFALAKKGQAVQVMRYNTIADVDDVATYRWAFIETPKATYSIDGDPTVTEGTVEFTEEATTYNLTITTDACEIFYKITPATPTTPEPEQPQAEAATEGGDTTEGGETTEGSEFTKAEGATITLPISEDCTVEWYAAVAGLQSATESISFKSPVDQSGIQAVETIGAAKQAIYDLQGRKLMTPAKGINIINGKKVLVK